MNRLYVVIPCFNEKEVLQETTKRLSLVFDQLIKQNKISHNSKILYVNDGSKDNTWDIINDLYRTNKYIEGLNLSRNKGHQNALLAGLHHASNYADIIISMDADLQDDVNAAIEMIDHYHQGYEVVYGVRKKREKDSFFKKTTAEAFYKIMHTLGVEIVFNHADYRLLSKRAVLALLDFKEVNLFLRGIIPLIGFKSCNVYYERSERFAGESKYPLKKMLSFAFEGITSFSIKPIRFITSLGFIIFFISILMLIYSVYQYFNGFTIPGWSSLIVSIWAIGGLQLLAIGIVGEYIGKIYLETKARPRYIIESYLKHEEN